MGYHRAGFEVVGIDMVEQPHYPFEHHVGDALSFPRCLPMWFNRTFDAIHASPPCQDHSILKNATGRTHGTGHLLGATRELLECTGLPWVIENVPGADMRADYRLCGCQFDNLPGLRRERWFETSWRGYDLRSPCSHNDQLVTVSGHGAQGWEYKLGRRTTQADDSARWVSTG